MASSSLVFDQLVYERGSFRLEADVCFPEGRLTVVLGPSGCGKSTLLDLAAGFLHPRSGRILKGNRDMNGLPPNRRRIGILFQDHVLFPHMSVRNNVAYGPIVRGMSRRLALKVADRQLEMVHLAAYGTRRPHTLSGGECQRVALARALAIEPDILLLDEPFSSIDAELRKSLREEILRIQSRTHITTVLVTHDQEEALAVADHLALMRNGCFVQTGSAMQVWRNPADLKTANFLGRSSCLRVRRFKTDAEGKAVAETAAGGIVLEGNTENPSLPAVIFLRPEDLSVEEQGELLGRVKTVEFAGSFWRVRLIPPAGNGEDGLEIDWRASPAPAIGEELRLTVRPGAARILGGKPQ